MHAAEPGSSRQLAAALGLVRCADAGSTAFLSGWLAGAGVPGGLAIDRDLRWTLLYRLVVLGQAGVGEIAAESDRDRSGQGVEEAARCRAAVPDPDAKARAWDLIVTNDVAATRIAMATADGFWQPEQAELTATYVSRYFAEMPAMAKRRSPVAVAQIATAAYPRYAVSPRTVAAARAMLTRSDLDVVLRRVVVNATHDLGRALAAFARWS
jgi:aminopeptidase N